METSKESDGRRKHRGLGVAHRLTSLNTGVDTLSALGGWIWNSYTTTNFIKEMMEGNQ